MEIGFNLQLFETSECTAPNGRRLLNVEMACSRLGVWRVEIREADTGRTIDVSHPTEADARRAVEVAYTYGRQSGGVWNIQRRQGYAPDPAHGPFSPLGREKSPDGERLSPRPRETR